MGGNVQWGGHNKHALIVSLSSLYIFINCLEKRYNQDHN